MKNSLYREEAVSYAQRTFDTRENLSALPLKIKLLAVVLALCLAVFCVWMFLGNLSQTLSADGIIYSQNGQYNLYAPSGGVVSDILVKTGDTVREGDVIAVIYNPDQLPGAEEAEFGRHVVRTVKSGVITEVCSEGMGVATGDWLAGMISLNDRGDDRIVYAFIPADEANSVALGMSAQVSLRYAPREKYGYFEGYVSSLGEYTVQGERLNQDFGRATADLVDERRSYQIAEITLLPDNESLNGLRTSNAQGATLQVEVGSKCRVDIIYGTRRPYEWLLGGK